MTDSTNKYTNLSETDNKTETKLRIKGLAYPLRGRVISATKARHIDLTEVDFSEGDQIYIDMNMLAENNEFELIDSSYSEEMEEGIDLMFYNGKFILARWSELAHPVNTIDII